MNRITPEFRCVLLSRFGLWVLFASLLGGGSPGWAAEEDQAAQRAKDARVVQVLLRLSGASLEGKPEHRAAVIRYLGTIQGEEKYFELIERFALTEKRDELLSIATGSSDGNVAASAARVLVKLADAEFLAKTIAGEEPKAVKLMNAIGLAGNASSNSLLLPLVTDAGKSLAIRSAAASAVGKNVPGQKALLSLVEQGKLAADLNFSVGNALFASPDPAIREAFYVSILDPSAGISHGFETYVVATDDGNVVTGILVSDTADAITIRTAEAIVRTFPKANVEEYKKQPVSLMPADLQKTMTVQDLVDVVEFLTTLKKMP